MTLLKNLNEIFANLVRGGRKHNGGLAIINENLKDMPMTDYLEYRKLVQLTTVEINPTNKSIQKFNPLEIGDTTPIEEHAINVCNVLQEVASIHNNIISYDELETVKILIIDGYSKGKPHTIKSLFEALSTDQEKNLNVLNLLNQLV